MTPTDYEKTYTLYLPFGTFRSKHGTLMTFKTLDNLLKYVWKNCKVGCTASFACFSGGSSKYLRFTDATISRGRDVLVLQCDLPSLTIHDPWFDMLSLAHALFVLPMQKYTLLVNDVQVKIKLKYRNKGGFDRTIKRLNESGWKKRPNAI